MGQREQTLRALAELRQRFDEVVGIVDGAQRAFAAAAREGRLDDDIWKRALGSYLHDFYTALENVFRAVTELTGEGLPRGEEWHRRLLDQMEREIEELRPALLSPESHRKLADYLGFRHVFRSAYGYQLDSERLRRLLQGLPDVTASLQRDFQRFEAFVRSLAGAYKAGGGSHPTE